MLVVSIAIAASVGTGTTTRTTTGTTTGTTITATCSGDVKANRCFTTYDDNIYNSGDVAGPTLADAVAQCCSQCSRDFSPDGNHHCLAFNVIQNGKTFTCFSFDLFNASRFTTKSSCTSGILHTQPPTIPPKPVKHWPSGAKNVLFLVADDMRPSIGPYGLKGSHTPNLDRIAREGTTFARAYIQQSYCAPSRNSFMSGRRPDATKAYSFVNHFRELGVGDQWTALPQRFVEMNYSVTGTGKMFHPNVPPNYDQPRSWNNDPEFWNKNPGSGNGDFVNVNNNATNLCSERCCGVEDPDQMCAFDLKNGTYLGDQRNTMEALRRLEIMAERYKHTGKPFFLGIGFHKPHLNWEFPQRFYDLVPKVEDIPPPAHPAFPADVPALGWHECAECSKWQLKSTGESGSIAYFNDKGEGRTPPPAQWQSEMRRAYMACIAYVDSLIGEALDALDRLGLASTTVVSFHGGAYFFFLFLFSLSYTWYLGSSIYLLTRFLTYFLTDHGWNLGEHDIWCKMTNYEAGTRIPLLFRAPWLEGSAGRIAWSLAEAVDIAPTLWDLAGVGIPSPDTPGGAHLGGVSLKSAMATGAENVNRMALSQFPRCWQNNTNHEAVRPGYGPGDEHNLTVRLSLLSLL